MRVSLCVPLLFLLLMGCSSVRAYQTELYVRSVPSKSATTLVGSFVRDDVTERDISESSLFRTECSDLMRTKEVAAQGEATEVLSASDSAAGQLGISVADAKAGTSKRQAYMANYNRTQVLEADYSGAELRQCCTRAPGLCGERFVVRAVRGTGSIYRATAREASADGKGVFSIKGIPGTAQTTYRDDYKWEQSLKVEDEYFAFSTARIPPRPIQACTSDASWKRLPPSSADGQFFVGVSEVMSSEQEARDEARRHAVLQAVASLAEYAASEQKKSMLSTSTSEQVRSFTSSRSARQHVTGGLISGLTVECFDEERIEDDPEGLAYKVWVLSYLSNQDRARSTNAALGVLIEATQRGDLNSNAAQELSTLTGPTSP